MKYTICYAYHPETGEFVGIDRTMFNPVRPSEFFKKENVTMMAPPATLDHEKAVWNGEVWERKPDYRGMTYWFTVDKSRREITELGKVPEVWWTDKEPIDPDCEWDDQKGDWVVPFSVRQSRKVIVLLAKADRKMLTLKDGYSQSEIDSWPRQENGAKEISRDADSTHEDAVFVRAIATERGVEIDEQVERILMHVATYREASARILGIQKRLVDKDKGATNDQELNAIEWPNE